MNKIYSTIINRKIETLVSMFIEDSSSIFFDNNRLIHPGEYGTYREKAVIELLKCVVNSKLNIEDGFIITSNDEVSTQCDIVVYDKSEVPILTSDISKFYTVESVACLGEIKSDLSKTDLKIALKKLADNKMLSRSRKSLAIKNRNALEHEDIVTFLICRKLKFDIQTIDFNEIYEDLPNRYRHNVILSIEDGLFTYIRDFSLYPEEIKKKYQSSGVDLTKKVINEYPSNILNNYEFKCVNHFIPTSEIDKYNHIKSFLSILVDSINERNIYSTDLKLYLGLEIAKVFI